jgi:hypothetical protein
VNAIRALLNDRRRSQRGSVLSGVLIITAFLAVIAGALMTELSTNFLLSTDLLNRVQTEATVSSAAEVAVNQLQGTPISAGCPNPAPFSMNGLTAVASIGSCATVIDKGLPQRFTPIASSSNGFQVDGTYARLPGLNDYVVGDSGGTVYDYPLSTTTPRWTLGLRGSVTGPPLVMPDPSYRGRYVDLIPASGPACAPYGTCIATFSDDGLRRTPVLQCVIATGTVTTRPAMSKNFPNVAFFGDVSGNVTAYNSTCTGFGGACDPDGGTACVPSGYTITQGPIVLSCTSCTSRTDNVYFVIAPTGAVGNSQLARFRYTSNGDLNPAGTWRLPWANATGIAVEPAGPPTRIAITFQGGGVDLVQLDSAGFPNPGFTTTISSTVSGAPYWCACPGPTNLIGVGGDNGSLYLLLPDANLQLYARSAAGPRIRTTPATDAAGNWYFAADNGLLYEMQKAAGTTMTLAASYGSAGAFRSSPVIGSCLQDVCVYLASTDARAYLVDLDARDVILTACLGNAASGCSGVNPRLWTSVEIGVADNPKAVHVRGWSYYSR